MTNRYKIEWRNFRGQDGSTIVEAPTAADAIFIFEFNSKGTWPRPIPQKISIEGDSGESVASGTVHQRSLMPKL